MCIKVPYQYTIYHMYWFWIDDHFIYDAKNSLKYWFLCGLFNNFIRCVLHRITKNICYILSLLYHSYTYRLSLSYDLSIPLSPFPYVSLFPLTIFFFLAILNLSSKLRVCLIKSSKLCKHTIFHRWSEWCLSKTCIK